MGDFNTPLYDSKNYGGSQILLDRKTNLMNFITNMALTNVEMCEVAFTWSNRQDGDELI